MEPEFLIVNTDDGWNDCDIKENLEVDLEVDGDSIVIMRDPVSTYVNVRQKIVYSIDEGSKEEINDISVDECGNLYIALTTYDDLHNSTGKILYYNRSDCSVDRICSCQSIRNTDTDTEPLRHITFKNPVGVRIGKDTIYIVDKGDKKLYSISRHLLQTKWTIENEFFGAASGIAVDGTGYFFVLNPEAKAIMKISPDGDTLDSAELGLIELEKRELLDISIDEADNLYVLEKISGGNDFIVRRFTKKSGKYIPEDWVTSKMFRDVNPAIGIPIPSCIARGPKDELLVGEAYSQGEDASGKTLLRFIKDKESFARIFAYNGSAHKILLDACMNLFVISGDCKNVICLTYGLKNNLSGENKYKARISKCFDSGKPDTIWHRLKLDFDLPGKMVQVQCRYYSSNSSMLDEKLLSQATPLLNPHEALFDNTKGRYLWIEISLLGTEFDSPRVRSLKVFFPRISYLRYLPAIYQEDEASSKFLERFLSIFESFFTQIEENIGSVSRYMDSGGVPSQYINWLGSWLSISTDEGWPENKKRELIAIAPELFKKRGTRQGLIQILKMFLKEREEVQADWKTAADAEINVLTKLFNSGYFTEEKANEELNRYIKFLIDVKYLKKENEKQLIESEEQLRKYLDLLTAPFDLNKEKLTKELIKYLNTVNPEIHEWEYLTILEYFQLDDMDEEIKETYRKLLECPLCFLVLVNSPLNREELKTARRIVDSEKPAHTTGNVIDLKPRIYLGGHTYLGINTILSRPKFILEEASLGKDAVLTEPEECGHLELKSRLDIDMLLS